MSELLYHISDDPQIERFVPRPVARQDLGMEPELVWAIDEAHMVNYLLPRDCPRACFYALPESTQADIERLMGTSSASRIIAIESAWFERVRSSRLYQYVFSKEGFRLQDAGAGYYVSPQTIVPLERRVIDDPLGALLERGVELRITPSLWLLYDQLPASSLQFSLIRMRNAQQRPAS
jgi:hypothetical protein